MSDGEVFSIEDIIGGSLNRPSITKLEWMDEVEMRLATTADLDAIAEECVQSKLFALDLETTGLDTRPFKNDDGTTYTNSKIVGYCIAASEDRGWYIPVRHLDSSANVPPRLVAEMLKKVCATGAVAIFHHAKFDQAFLDHDAYGPIGDWTNPNAWEDTLILAYLRNSRERNKGLKALSKRDLGMEMIELPSLFPLEERKKKDINFGTLDPTWEPCVWYAASDAICTFRLFKLLHPLVVERDDHGMSQRTIYKVEKGCSLATRWMESCRIYVDRNKVVELIQLGQAEWFDSLKAVYDEGESILGRSVRPEWFKLMCGEQGFNPQSVSPTYMEAREEAVRKSGPEVLMPVEKSVPSLTDPNMMETVAFPLIYDVTIPAVLGQMLREIGVQGLVATEKSGQVKTSKDELERVINEAGDKFPFMGKIKRFREVAKALSTNLFPIINDTEPDRSPDQCMWIGFNGTKVDTGRFATPSPRKGGFNGQTRWNLHSIPATYDKSKPECMRRVRECLSARPGHIMFAIDYSGVELRIVTNLSREPKWLDEFFRCAGCNHRFPKGELPPPFCPKCGSDKIGDLHSLTALSVFGDNIKGTPQFKQRRQEAKGLNFAMCYGGGGSAAQRSVGVSKEEGWRLKKQFDKGYRGLVKWWKSQHGEARRQKYVTTAYGRKYPLPDIDHEMGGFRSKAERNSVNGPVQGTSADIMKLAMFFLYREIHKRGWQEDVLMTITIHDELVFEIKEHLAGEAIAVIEKLMCVDAVAKLGWDIPLKVDIEFGANWTVPMNLTEMAHNQGGGRWDARLAGIFPARYASYLENGGSPIGGTPQDPEAPKTEAPTETVAPKTVAPTETAETAESRVEVEIPRGSSGDHVFQVAKSRLSPDFAERLARVILKCRGRGTDLLRIETEDGEPILEDPMKVSILEFQIIARYEGL